MKRFYNFFNITGTIQEITKNNDYITIDFVPLETSKSIRFFVSEKYKSGNVNTAYEQVEGLANGDKVKINCCPFNDKLFMRSIKKA